MYPFSIGVLLDSFRTDWKKALELAEKTGIRQSNISRIESGASSPTVDTLARIAAGLGKKLKIEFQ